MKIQIKTFVKIRESIFITTFRVRKREETKLKTFTVEDNELSFDMLLKFLQHTQK